MKACITLILTLAVAGGVSASPASSANDNAFARREEANTILASRSISANAATFAAASYDYIIVGGGTAGLALAARLSENGKHTVGVLEAGTSGLGVPIIDVPADFGADIQTIYDCECFRMVYCFSSS